MLRLFPVAAPTSFTSSYAAPRSGGRAHEGNDLFADRGSPLIAVDDGQVRSGRDPLGGNILNLYGADGTRYYYAHLDAFTDGLATLTDPPAPRMVRAGDIVGFLGNTGNAAATPPHVHFEIHPGNGAAIDPYATLRAAPRMDTPRNMPTTSSTRRVLVTVGAVALLGIGTWALLYPRDAQTFVRRRLGVAIP